MAKLQAEGTSAVVAAALPVAAGALDSQGRVTFWNAAAERLYGWTADEALGRVPPTVAPDSLSAFQDQLAKAIGGEEATVEVERLRKDGSSLRVRERTAAAIDADGELLGVVWTAEPSAPSSASEAPQLLREAARQLGESLDPERVYDHFHELVADVIPHDGVIVSSYDERDDLIRCEYAWTDGKKLDPAQLPPLTLNREGEGMQSRVIVSGEGLLMNDVAERIASGRGTYYNVGADGSVRKVAQSEPVPTRAALMVPIKHEGRVVGVVQLMSERTTYTRAQLELMEGIVAQMAAAVRNARLYQALAESGARFRAIFDSAAVGIAEVALDGRWLRVNDRLCEITGYSREELSELRFQDITPPDDAALDTEQGRRMLGGEIERYTREKRYRRKDGDEVPVSVTVSLVRDAEGRPVRFVSVVEDITTRREAEAERQRLVAAEEAASAIAREREQEARVLAAIADGIVLVDHEGVVRVWNAAAERITGLEASLVVGKSLEEVLPGWAEVRRRIDRANGASRPETLPLDLGGRDLWLSITTVETADGVVYAFRDLTAERRLDEAKTELVATVSHELRTPLSAVYGAAQTLLHREGELTASQRVTLLEMIAAQTQRLSQIADQFLVASRLETGELPIASEAVDVVELARETVEAMGSRAPAGPPIELTCDDAVSPAHVDPHRLRQVLVNLLDNAIKYSPQGRPVNVSVESRERRIRLSVSDRGRGIPRSQHSRIFEKFYRLDPDLAQGAGGTGLGLYICRELVERMGGRIGLESVEGRGSTFFVDLPRAGS